MIEGFNKIENKKDNPKTDKLNEVKKIITMGVAMAVPMIGNANLPEKKEINIQKEETKDITPDESHPKEFNKFFESDFVLKLALYIKDEQKFHDLILEKNRIIEAINNKENDQVILLQRKQEINKQIDSLKIEVTEKDKEVALDRIRKIITIFNQAKKEITNHIKSKSYKTKLNYEIENEEYEKNEYKKRKKAVNNVEYDLADSADIKFWQHNNLAYSLFDPLFGEITLPFDVDLSDQKNKDKFYESVLHEMLHQLNKGVLLIPDNSKKLIRNAFTDKNIKDIENIGYLSNPGEILVRKQILDLEMERLGIKKYKEKFTEEHYKKLLELKEQNKLSKSAEELIEIIKPEYFSRIINEIAENIEQKQDYYNSGWNYNDQNDQENKA